jgi:hypothetical protein
MGKRYGGGVWRLRHRVDCRGGRAPLSDTRDFLGEVSRRRGLHAMGQREALGPGTGHEFAIRLQVLTSRVNTFRRQASLHLIGPRVPPLSKASRPRRRTRDRTTHWFSPVRRRSVSRRRSPHAGSDHPCNQGVQLQDCKDGRRFPAAPNAQVQRVQFGGGGVSRTWRTGAEAGMRRVALRGRKSAALR